MSKEDFKVLDELILRRVGVCPIKFAAVYSGAVHEECRRIQGKLSHIVAFRFCDRRLQALRKAGSSATPVLGGLKTG